MADLDKQIADFTSKLCAILDIANEQIKEINNDLKEIIG